MRPIFKFFLVASVFTLALTTPSIAQDLTEKSENLASKEVKEGTRIIISTSGSAKFKSYWPVSYTHLTLPTNREV